MFHETTFPKSPSCHSFRAALAMEVISAWQSALFFGRFFVTGKKVKKIKVGSNHEYDKLYIYIHVNDNMYNM